MHSLKSVWPKFRAQITRRTLNILGREEADYLQGYWTSAGIGTHAIKVLLLTQR